MIRFWILALLMALLALTTLKLEMTTMTLERPGPRSSSAARDWPWREALAGGP